jgi:hypothetical protein
MSRERIKLLTKIHSLSRYQHLCQNKNKHLPFSIHLIKISLRSSLFSIGRVSSLSCSVSYTDSTDSTGMISMGAVSRGAGSSGIGSTGVASRGADSTGALVISSSSDTPELSD